MHVYRYQIRLATTSSSVAFFTMGTRELSKKIMGTREHKMYWGTGEQSPSTCLYSLVLIGLYNKEHKIL